MPELTPAALRMILAKIERGARSGTRTGLVGVAKLIADQAKTNASSGSHAYGTPTPARPGSGPAQISGTLKSSITSTTPGPTGVGWEIRVGLAPGKSPPYRKGRGATSSKYGSYLENGLKNGTKFPFLKPATNLVHIQADVAFRKAFQTVKWS
ncbi:hypothetical protein KCMC57_63990 (plasmid) [Kitasatospora sp. CMC57]|uniref:HK97 gp10 family phage protein n=1 Tax=Kitasatospora sp. CMC57 TaxID=3231513 RepID=A0AB33K3G3_9ACTN